MKNHKAGLAHNAPQRVAEIGNRAIQRMLDDPALHAAIGARFWALTNIPKDRDQCWLWKGATRGQHKYGSFKLVSYVTVSAHRVAWALGTGMNPGQMLVLHRCDVPQCVNPSHLFLGTHEDNMADMAAKGRQSNGDSSGENNPGAKLTEAQAIEAITLIDKGLSNREIGAMFGVTHGAISQIRRGKSWPSLPRPREFTRYGSLRRPSD